MPNTDIKMAALLHSRAGGWLHFRNQRTLLAHLEKYEHLGATSAEESSPLLLLTLLLNSSKN